LDGRRDRRIPTQHLEQKDPWNDDRGDDRHGSETAGVGAEYHYVLKVRRRPDAGRGVVGERRKAMLNLRLQQSRHRGHPGRAAELAQETVDPRSIGAQLGCEGRERERAEGREQ